MSEKVCSVCGKKQSDFKKCSICWRLFDISTYYCSKLCQRTDWPSHKRAHRSNRALEVEIAQRATTKYEPLSEKNCKQLFNSVLLGLLDMVIHYHKKHGKQVLLQATTDGQSYLFQACLSGHRDIVKYLVRYGGKELIRKQSNDGSTGIHVACLTGSLEIVQILLEADGHYLLKIAACDGHTPIMIACQEGHLQIVKTLLEFGGPNLLHHVTVEGRTALTAAVENMRIEVVKFLLGLSEVSEMLEHRIKAGATALMTACSLNRLPLVKLLIAAGADVHTTSENGHSIMFAALFHDATEVLSYLLQHYPEILWMKSSFGNIVFHEACSRGAIAQVRKMVAVGGSEVVTFSNIKNHNGLMTACQEGHLEIVRFLLEEGPAVEESVRQVSMRGSTCLHLAAQNGQTSVVQYLVKGWGDSLLLRTDDSSLTALHFAARYGFHGTVDALLNHDLGKNLLLLPCSSNLMAVDYANAGGHTDIANFLLDQMISLVLGSVTTEKLTEIFYRIRAAKKGGQDGEDDKIIEV